MLIRLATSIDAPDIAEIYNYYIRSSHATFELEEISNEDIKHRLEATAADQYPFLVAIYDDKVAGYAYAHRYRHREAYRGSVETSVYIRNDLLGKGIGSGLYQELLSRLKSAGFHTVLAGIALPNDLSVRLHENLGFHKIAHFREVGWKFERWFDVGFWQLML